MIIDLAYIVIEKFVQRATGRRFSEVNAPDVGGVIMTMPERLRSFGEDSSFIRHI